MKLAARVSGVLPSATLAMAARAKALKQSGVTVFDFAAGEPDFDTPTHIKDAAKRALDAGDTKYSPVPGSMPLRKAIAELTTKTYDRPFDAEQVIVGAGGKQVLFNAYVCLVDPGDEAIIPAPYWVSYPDMVRFSGGVPVFVSADESQGFLPSAEAFAKVITPKTRVLVLNSPSNPTGATYERKRLEEIAELVRAHKDITVLTDDMYGALCYDAPFVSFAHVAPDLTDRTLIVNAVSKTYAMTGWRVGWGVGPKALVGAMGRVQGASTSGASSIAQAAAVQALVGDQSPADAMRQTFKARRDRIVQALQKIPGLSIHAPGGAFYAFPRIDAFLKGKVKTSQQLCEHLLDTVHVAAVPGDAFGSDAHIRLSFACSEATIDQGIAKLAEGLRGLL